MTALENLLSPEIVQKLGWTLLHFVWQAAVVALLLAILLRVLRKPEYAGLCQLHSSALYSWGWLHRFGLAAYYQGCRH